jgi:hypothetical protein
MFAIPPPGNQIGLIIVERVQPILAFLSTPLFVGGVPVVDGIFHQGIWNNVPPMFA